MTIISIFDFDSQKTLAEQDVFKVQWKHVQKKENILNIVTNVEIYLKYTPPNIYKFCIVKVQFLEKVFWVRYLCWKAPMCVLFNVIIMIVRIASLPTWWFLLRVVVIRGACGNTFSYSFNVRFKKDGEAYEHGFSSTNLAQ